MAQLLLFEQSTEDKLEMKMRLLEEKYHNLRKGQYAKITKLQGEVKDLIAQMEFLQACIAKNGYTVNSGN